MGNLNPEIIIATGHSQSDQGGYYPPAGIQITVRQIQPEVILERVTLGNALGGIRLPQFAVPLATTQGKMKDKVFVNIMGRTSSLISKH
jgi:hypothetical protein